MGVGLWLGMKQLFDELRFRVCVCVLMRKLAGPRSALFSGRACVKVAMQSLRNESCVSPGQMLKLMFLDLLLTCGCM